MTDFGKWSPHGLCVGMDGRMQVPEWVRQKSRQRRYFFPTLLSQGLSKMRINSLDVGKFTRAVFPKEKKDQTGRDNLISKGELIGSHPWKSTRG